MDSDIDTDRAPIHRAQQIVRAATHAVAAMGAVVAGFWFVGGPAFAAAALTSMGAADALIRLRHGNYRPLRSLAVDTMIFCLSLTLLRPSVGFYLLGLSLIASTAIAVVRSRHVLVAASLGFAGAATVAARLALGSPFSPAQLHELDLIALYAMPVIIGVHMVLSTGALRSHLLLGRQLRSAESRLRELIARTPVAVYRFDAHGTIVFADGPGLELTGQNPVELIGTSALDDRFGPDLVDMHRRALAGEDVSSRVPVGEAVFDVFYRPEVDESGSVTGVDVIAVDVTHTQAVADVLKRQEERFTALVRHTNDLISLVDARGRFTYVSPSAAPVFGYAPEELVGSTGLDLVHPDDVERVRQLFVDLGATPGAHDTATYRAQRGDGTWIHLESAITNLLDHPAVEAWVVIQRDVTERVKAEERLEITEERFRRAFYEAPVGATLSSPDRMIFEVNAAFGRFVGYTEDELVGMRWNALAPADADARNDRLHDELIGGARDHYEVEKRYVHRDGHEVWGHATVTSITDTDGRLIATLAYVRDITQQRRDRDHLERRNRELTGLQRISEVSLQADNLPAAAQEIVDVISTSTGFPIVTIELYDEQHDTLTFLGTKGFEPETPVVSADDIASGPVARTGRPIAVSEPCGSAPCDHKAGIHTFVSVPMVVDDGILGVLCLGHHETLDIGDEVTASANTLANHVAALIRRRRAEDKLEALVRSKDELIASISHEVRTPLTAVVGLSAELHERGDAIDAATGKELIELIADQSLEISHIVEDLLVAARSEIETLTVLRAPVELHAEARSVVDHMMRSGSPGAHAIRFGGGEAVAVADRHRVRQVIRNLLSNAVRYGGDAIEIEAHNGNGRATLIVRDDGAGIPEAEWESIFDAYTRSHNAAGQPASVGIGLTVARRLARLMGGDLTYRHDGTHSVFELALPCAERHAAASA